MKINPPSKSPRKRKKKPNSTSKTVYREHQLMRRLLRYTDRERVSKLSDIDAIEDLPNEFFANVEGQTPGKVRVNWSAINASLEATFDAIAKGRSSGVTPQKFSEAKRLRARDAVFYVFEFLPEVIDAAIGRLCIEALTKVSVDRARPWVRSWIEGLSKMDYDDRLMRLGIHEGARARFQHRSQYETALTKAIYDLLKEGRNVTQGTVAEKLSVESEDSLDCRVLRRWNKEFGVNWKLLVRRAKRTSLT